MLAIRTDDNCNGSIIGQSGYKDKKDHFVPDGYIIYEVESLPTDIDYEDITETSYRFWQRNYDGKYGEYVSYSECLTTRRLIDTDGEADSLDELNMNIIQDFKDRLKIVEVYLGLGEASNE